MRKPGLHFSLQAPLAEHLMPAEGPPAIDIKSRKEYTGNSLLYTASHALMGVVSKPLVSYRAFSDL